MSNPTQFKISLGDKVRDTVSGFTGVVVSRSEYLNGCIRYGVQPPVGKKPDTLPDAFYLDEDQLEVITPKAVPVAAKVVRTGGPRPNPSGPQNPSRR